MSLKEFTLDVRGVKAQCWEGGEGFPVLLFHGSGPGAASLGTWRFVFEPLMERFHVYCTDLIGFGQSGRKPEPPYFDLDLWQAQAEALLDAVPGDAVGVVGHSISGTIAMRLAARSRRVVKLMTTATMGASFLQTPYTGMCWTFPETKEDLRRTLMALMHDHSGITDDLLESRLKILHDGVYGPYFRSMFAGDKQAYIEAATVSSEDLARITCEVMMIHGRNDLLFPAEVTTTALSQRLPQADVLLLARCGHLPAMEHPKQVAGAMRTFFG
ncbi:alpha/beta fold hydrolase [Azospirillum sp. ST 5-10]|uniref:alpha/beta fold hydrolase n=1 Tax=unclassified Azospirillum TaxID=2630922 RepID=UPI003F49FBEA